MMRKIALIFWIICFLCFPASGEKERFLEKFGLKKGKLHLSRGVQPRTYFDAVGQKSAVLGRENGNTEVWIYPYKVLHNFQLYFLIEDENEIIEGKDVAKRIDVHPHQTIIRYVHSSFQVEEVFFTPLREGGVVILLSVKSIKPLSVIASFTPDLKPMWPAGLGGQYSYWDNEKKYFVLSEGTRRNVALVGSPEGERFSSGPAHALPEGDMKIKIHVEPETSKETFFPIFISASHSGRKLADDIYIRMGRDFEKLYMEKFRYMDRLLHEHLSIRTPNDLLNQAFQWAKVAVDNAFVCNPQLGCGLVAGYGLSRRSERPGFAWFFGGDTFFNSWAINSYGFFDVTRQGLALIRKNQREDGKIMHELSQGAGFIPWFDKYPYGYYHAETSPYYIVALHDYLNSSGDVRFIQESWPSIKKAYQYVLNADTDGDGLMENTVAGLAALELGAFLKNTKSDVYLAALSTECHRVFSEIALLMNDEALSNRADKTFSRALNALREKFWVEEEKRYAHAITVEDEPLMETTVWPSMPLFFGHLPRERADYILDILASSEMSTDWGVRSLSPESSQYDPQNYNYGTVWPFLTGYSCLAEYNYGRSLSGYSHLVSLAHNSFIDALGNCSELFSGEFFTPLETSVPHQVFSSSPVITCLVRGLFGLKGNALNRDIEFSPSFPGSWKNADIKNFKIGEDVFHFNVQRSESRFVVHIDSQAEETYHLHLSPSVGYGARVISVKVNGEEVEFRTEENYGEVRCAVSLEIAGKTEVEIVSEKSILLDFSPHFPQVGDTTTNMKIIRTQFKNNEMRILVEGLGTKEYTLSVFTARPVVSASEAEVADTEGFEKKIKIHFIGQKDIYSRKEVIIRF
jgi:glycogen debranching enzyme